MADYVKPEYLDEGVKKQLDAAAALLAECRQYTAHNYVLKQSNARTNPPVMDRYEAPAGNMGQFPHVAFASLLNTPDEPVATIERSNSDGDINTYPPPYDAASYNLYPTPYPSQDAGDAGTNGQRNPSDLRDPALDGVEPDNTPMGYNSPDTVPLPTRPESAPKALWSLVKEMLGTRFEEQLVESGRMADAIVGAWHGVEARFIRPLLGSSDVERIVLRSRNRFSSILEGIISGSHLFDNVPVARDGFLNRMRTSRRFDTNRLADIGSRIEILDRATTRLGEIFRQYNDGKTASERHDDIIKNLGGN